MTVYRLYKANKGATVLYCFKSKTIKLDDARINFWYTVSIKAIARGSAERHQPYTMFDRKLFHFNKIFRFRLRLNVCIISTFQTF